MDGLRRAADWLEHGRPGERVAAAEVAEFGELLWSSGGFRCFARTDADAFRLRIAGGAGAVVYEVLSVDGGWLR